jgi:hypothetical protein
MPRRYWTCRKCSWRNERTASRYCQNCGEPTKPKAQKPKHALALELPYEGYVELNQRIHKVGEVCALCGREPTGRRLDRDHDHRTGDPRGLLCWACNHRLRLRGGDTSEWLMAALKYTIRAEEYWRLQKQQEEAS